MLLTRFCQEERNYSVFGSVSLRLRLFAHLFLFGYGIKICFAWVSVFVIHVFIHPCRAPANTLIMGQRALFR